MNEPGKLTSLKRQAHVLSDPATQISVLQDDQRLYKLVPFQEKLEQSGLYPLRVKQLEIFQVNLGKMCNQVCKHCHVDAGPDRKEIMALGTMQQCLDALIANPSLKTVDLTGGAPEMNPHFRWFVQELRKLDCHIIVRCNLTIILANKKYNDLPRFYKENDVELVSSLPFYTADRTNRQRGDGVFEQSIKALQMLNNVGYGIEGSGLILNLVYNPAGAFMPPPQSALEKEYKKSLGHEYNIQFNRLFAITNLPISRYLDYLLKSGNYEKYMERLVNSYNQAAAANVMCRNTISISWEGFLYDCDFNQMLDMKVNASSRHISQFNVDVLSQREIVVNQHCFGCTAGSGSSCGGSVT